MIEQPVLAEHPTDVKVTIVRDNSNSAARETTMSTHFPSMSEMISSALAKMEEDGYALADIRYSAIPTGGQGHEHFAMLIGRKRPMVD